jgi:predicted metal-dependent enzyme (double-stranded beta helix superfamily)
METTTTYGIGDLVSDLRRITADTADHKDIIRQVGPLAKRLAADTGGWLSKDHYRCDEEQGFGVHLLHEEPNHDLAVFAVAWLPDRGTPPHDHGTWAVVVGIDGDETNINWRRLDDGLRPGHAELEEYHRVVAGHGEVMTFLPRDIHTVWNETGQVTLSLHIYGRHVNHTERSRFDTENDTEERFVVKVE